MNENKEKVSLMPVYVLSAIALIVTLLLALVYGVANPIILANAEKTANANRQELLSEADGFTEYTGELKAREDGKASVVDCYVADNGTGAVLTVSTKSFGGALTMMIGVDANNSVTGVKVTDHADTPGLGTKNFTEDYLGQYNGMTVDVIGDNVKKQSGLTYTSGASVTGQALQLGVQIALEQVNEIGGAN